MTTTEIRSQALLAAATYLNGKPVTKEDVLRTADYFEEYILTGQK